MLRGTKLVFLLVYKWVKKGGSLKSRVRSSHSKCCPDSPIGYRAAPLTEGRRRPEHLNAYKIDAFPTAGVPSLLLEQGLIYTQRQFRILLLTVVPLSRSSEILQTFDMEKTTSNRNESILPLSSPTTTTDVASNRGGQGPTLVRTEIPVFLGEFIGTFMFLFLAFAGTQIAITSATINPEVAPDSNPVQEVSKLLYIAFAFSGALAINVAMFADVSGAMFNPAVSSLFSSFLVSLLVRRIFSILREV
jgi:hypothetical protein